MYDTAAFASNFISLFHENRVEPSKFIQEKIRLIGKLNLSIETQVCDMCKILEVHFKETDDDPCYSSIIDYTKRSFYRLLELLFKKELSDESPDNCYALLSTETFYYVLFACSFELVNFSRKSTNKEKLTFPWVLESLHISAYDMVRIIEVVIRADNKSLSREFVSYLENIEEMILEKLGWRSGSPIWKYLCDSDLPFPKCNEVFREPGRFLGGNTPTRNNTPKIYSPIYRFNESRYGISPSRALVNKFNSPLPKNLSVIRNLSADLSKCSDPKCSSSPAKVDSVEKDSTNEAPSTKLDSPEKFLRSGSHCLFIRKFYLLSAKRIRNLCDNLEELKGESIRQKIWDVFHFIISSQPCILINRHLDQIIICSIFAIGTKASLKFSLADIIDVHSKLYPKNISITETVLLGPEMTIKDAVDTASRRSLEREGSLHSFYEIAFLPKIQSFSDDLNFFTNEIRAVLSPLPHNNAYETRRLRVCDNQNVFVKNIQPLWSSPLTNSPGTQSFTIIHSPMKSLEPLSPNPIRKNIIALNKRMSSDSVDNSLLQVKQVQNLISERTVANYPKVRKSE